MMLGFFVIIILLCVLNTGYIESFRTLVFLLLYGGLLLLIVRNVVKPFTQMMMSEFPYVPYIGLLLLCAISVFGMNVVTSLLEQLELESIIPLAEITMRFTLFVYCFQQLKPALLTVRTILGNWS